MCTSESDTCLQYACNAYSVGSWPLAAGLLASAPLRLLSPLLSAAVTPQILGGKDVPGVTGLCAWCEEPIPAQPRPVPRTLDIGQKIMQCQSGP